MTFKNTKNKKRVNGASGKNPNPIRTNKIETPKGFKVLVSKKGLLGSQGALARKGGVLDRAFTPVFNAESGFASGIQGIGGGLKLFSNPMFLIGAGVVAIVVVPRLMRASRT